MKSKLIPESILTVRLTAKETVAIDEIVKGQCRVSSGTRAGAIRQMILHWLPLLDELRTIKAYCETLSQDNAQYSTVIADFGRSLDAIQSLHEEKVRRSASSPRHFPAGDHGYQRDDTGAGK